ncbi:MAG: sigma-54-dependent transcriptional regulator [Planctomycetota bacterium]|jgi:two-component system response regulator AtoC/two-component system nitrogen regulation response regulator NtrX
MAEDRDFSILVVDDEQAARYSVTRAFSGDYDVREADSGEAALASMEEEPADLVLLDLSMPGMDGMETLAKLRELPAPPPVIMITAHGSERLAVEAIRRGAEDYIAKPYELDELKASVRNALERVRLERENARLREEIARTGGERPLLGESAPMRELRSRIQAVAEVDVTVLIRGESGTGKELVAREIHRMSSRSGGPFVGVNAAAIPDGLVESELFGHERGAFTGADRRREGRFEQAAGGTLFLDEIGDMPLAAQAKVLRLLEERTFERVGGGGSVAADVRLITATHHDLREEIERSRFREDLYYRIRVVELVVPPLRERGPDVLLLAGRFAQEFATRYGKGVVGFTDDAIEALGSYAWPGNVRELRNAVETGVVLAGGERIGLAELPEEVRGGGGVPVPSGEKWEPLREASKRSQERFERTYISRALKESAGNTSAAARLLGMYRQTLQNKMRALGVSADDFRRQDRPPG